MHPRAQGLLDLLGSRDPAQEAQGRALLAALGEERIYADILAGWGLDDAGRLGWRGPQDAPPLPAALALELWLGAPPGAKLPGDLDRGRVAALRLQLPEDAAAWPGLGALPALRRLRVEARSRGGWSNQRLPALPPGLEGLSLRGFRCGVVESALAEAPAGLARLSLEECEVRGLRLAGLARLRLRGCVGLIDLAPLGDSLERLEIEGLALPNLPLRLPPLARLERLRLMSGQRALPAGLGGLPRLRELDLAGSRLERLSEEIGDLPMLQRLSLRGNPLRVLPAAVGRLEALEELDLSGTGIEALPAELAGLAGLRCLAVSPALRAAAGRLAEGIEREQGRILRVTVS